MFIAHLTIPTVLVRPAQLHKNHEHSAVRCSRCENLERPGVCQKRDEEYEKDKEPRDYTQTRSEIGPVDGETVQPPERADQHA